MSNVPQQPGGAADAGAKNAASSGAETTTSTAAASAPAGAAPAVTTTAPPPKPPGSVKELYEFLRAELLARDNAFEDFKKGLAKQVESISPDLKAIIEGEAGSAVKLLQGSLKEMADLVERAEKSAEGLNGISERFKKMADGEQPGAAAFTELRSEGDAVAILARALQRLRFELGHKPDPELVELAK